MKNLNLIAAGFILLFSVACNNTKSVEADGSDNTLNDDTEMTVVNKPSVKPGQYINLNTGETVYIIANRDNGIAVDSISKATIEFYYDPITLDTLYKNGLVVNNLLIKEGEGKYRLDDTKIKIDGNEIKIKSENSKTKIDGDDMKMKNGDEKLKVDDKEEIKIKSDEGKTKIENGEMKSKPKN